VVLLFENLVIPSVSSTSSNYYVSITGNDITGDGSLTHPWRTIQKAANMVLAGDTVYVRGGTYFEEVRIQDKHGTNDSWITFMPYNNEVVIVDGRNIQTSWGHAIFRTTNASYIRITGFKLYNSARVGVWINTHANYIRIDNNEIYNCSGNGIYTETYELYTITNIFFENNSVDYVNNNWSGYGGTSSEGVSFRTVQYFTINNNRISRCGKECIDVKQGSAYGTVHHNMIDTSSVPGGFNEDYNHVGIYCDGMSNRNHDIDIYNNYIYGSHGPGIVIGVEEPTGSLDNVCVYNNIVNITWVSGAGIGIVNWGEIGGEPISDVFIYGNTVKTKSHPALSIGATNIQNIVVKNNIFTTEGYFTLSVWSYPQNATVLTLSHNLFYRFGGVAHNRWMDGEDLSWGDNSQIKDPFFTPNFRVMNGSPAVDNGSVVPVSFDFDENDRPQGNGYDIGAYEFLIISPVWDINEDGICDIYDLVCISNHFGEIGVPGWIREDADNNGEVQVLDLVSVSNHYGASW
jgi:hypothetical protein